MKNKRLRGLLLFSLSLALMVMACGLGGTTSEPTAPPPTNTTAPPPPTEAPPPTEVPTEPPPEPTEVPPTDVPEPTPEPEAPAEVYVSKLASYQDQYDSWHVVGLIMNNTDRAVDDVEVEIEAFDTSENSIYLEVARAALYSIAPGETSPFVHWVFDDLEDFDHFTAAIVGQSAAELDRTEIEIRGTLMVIDDDGNVHVTGELYNPTEEPVEIGGIAAATFDADGNLMTADNYAVSIRYLDPDEAGPFRITMTGPGEGVENIAEYMIYLDVETSPGEQSWDLVFIEDHNNYMDYYDSFHLVGEVTNNSEEALSISIIAAVYDADGNVLDASSANMPISALTTGETIAYDFDVWGPLNYLAATFDSADSYTVQWDPYWTWTSSREYVDLVTQNTIEDFDEGDGKITGEVLNNSGGLVDGAIVIVTFYDIETGEIYASAYDSLWDEIPDGETDIFEIWFDLETDFDRDAYEYTVIVKGELP